MLAERQLPEQIIDEIIEEAADFDKVERSHEYGSGIIHSMETGNPRVVYGNVLNTG